MRLSANHDSLTLSEQWTMSALSTLPYCVVYSYAVSTNLHVNTEYITENSVYHYRKNSGPLLAYTHVSATLVMGRLSYACTSSHLELGPLGRKSLRCRPFHRTEIHWTGSFGKWGRKPPKTSHLLKEERKSERKKGKSVRIHFLPKEAAESVGCIFWGGIRPFCCSSAGSVLLFIYLLLG